MTNKSRTVPVVMKAFGALLFAAVMLVASTGALGQIALTPSPGTATTIQKVERMPVGQLFQGPDLVIQNVQIKNGWWTATVKNVGTADAVFLKSAQLVDQSSEILPAGAKISVAQVVDIKLDKLNVYNCWLCPASFDDPIQYGITVYADPAGAVSESNEQNNGYQLQRPNPFLSSASGMPDLKVIDLVKALEYQSHTADESSRWSLRVKYKNVGAAPVRYCNNVLLQTVRVYINGQEETANVARACHYNSFIMQPGEDNETNAYYCSFVLYGKKTTWGVTDMGNEGCNEIKVVVDPDAKIAESDECRNTTYFYVPIGAATCPADKITKTPSVCLAPKPVMINERILKR